MNSIICALFATMAMGFASCDNGEDPGNDVPDEEAVFPELKAFLPEEDVYKQVKSAKRGVATNFLVPQMPELMGRGISWCYNWSHNSLPDSRWQMLDENGVTFYPMVWNGPVNSSGLVNAKAKGSEYVLGYNEPNLTDQANMTPSQAAAVWGNYISAANNAGLKATSPAMCYGTLAGYGDPIVWFDEFLTKSGVSLDQMDAIPLHAYMPDAAGVKEFIRRFAKYGKPLWLTEFAHDQSGGTYISNADLQYGFMSDIITYLEADPAVEKYSWFMDTRRGSSATSPPRWELIDRTNTTMPVLNDLGRLYVSISSLDKTTYYNVDENIPAEHYCNHNAVESAAAKSGWTPGPLPVITSDIYGTLEISNFITGTWMEYQVDVPKSGTYRFDIRYATSRNTEVVLSAEGEADQILEIPKSADSGYDAWTTIGIPVKLKEGRQTIRLTHQKGTSRFNWFRITSPISK